LSKQDADQLTKGKGRPWIQSEAEKGNLREGIMAQWLRRNQKKEGRMVTAGQNQQGFSEHHIG